MTHKITFLLLAAGLSAFTLSISPLALAKPNSPPAPVAPMAPTASKPDKVQALFEAIQTQQFESVQTLLATGLSPDCHNDKGQTPLHLAAQLGHSEILTLLIKSGAPLNAVALDGNTPLLQAIEAKQPESARLLCQAGAQTQPTRQSPGALELALRLKAFEMADIVAQNSPALKEDDPYTLLFSAVSIGNLSGLHWLADHGLDLSTRGPEGETLLMEAPVFGGQAMVRYLLEAGVDIKAKDKRGRNLLFYIVSSLHRPEMLEYLLEQGAEVNTVAPEEMLSTPLLVAAYGGWYDNVVSLLEFGADTHVRDALGRNALSVALAQGGAVPGELKKMVKLFLEMDMDLQQPDKNGDTPVLLALQQGELEIAKMLLAKGAPLNTHDPATANTLLEAIHQGSLETVQFLHDKGLPLSGPLYHENLPLGRAASANQMEILDYLLAEGVDINEQDASGQTALHQACLLGCKDAIVRHLIELGADPNLHSKGGHTVLDLARNWRDQKMIELLTPLVSETAPKSP